MAPSSNGEDTGLSSWRCRVQLPAVTPCLRDQEADCAAPLRQCASNAPVVRIHPQTFIQELSEVLSVI